MDRRRAGVAAVIAFVSAVVGIGLITLQFFDPIFGYAEEKTLGWRQRSVIENQRFETVATVRPPR